MHPLKKIRAAIFAVLLATSVSLFAQNSPEWSQPLAPHHVIGNVHYVGSRGLASFLITTPEGHILINSSLTNSVPLIKDSVEKLGFKFTDIKILLISHAHWDHCAGSAELLKLTGAKYMVMDADVPVIESGGKADFFYGNFPYSLFATTKVDRILHDGDEVKLGGATLVAHKTPGHTKGCTTWSMKVDEGGKSYDMVIVGSLNYGVVLVGSPNVNPVFNLVNNANYPDIAKDYEKCFQVLKSLPCDIFLGAHGDYYGMLGKLARVKEGSPNPFIDPDGYKRYVASKEQAFRAELKRQQP